MKAILVVLTALALSGPAALAQTDERKNSSTAATQAKSEASAKAKANEATLDAGSRIDANLNSSLDLRKAKPGDSFKMKTKRAVKRGGKEVISRGSTITGHVEEVTRAGNVTKVNLLFDQIEDKKTGAAGPLHARVLAVTRVEQSASTTADEPMAPPRRQQGGQRQANGGLLGGVTSTVGATAGQVTSTVDSTTKGTLGAGADAGGATGGLTRGTIQILTDATATATSATTLEILSARPVIESGTTFVLKTTSALTLTSREEKPKSN